MLIEVRSQLFISCNSPQILDEIKSNLVKTNPDFIKAKRMGYPTHSIPPSIVMYENSGKCILAPRCSIEMVRQVCAKHGERILVKDNRTEVDAINVGLKDVQLFWYQEKAIKAMEQKQHGIVVAPCLVGDTIINVNRGGNGRQYTIKEMHERLNSTERYSWDKSIPTRVRAFNGERIISHPIDNVVYSGYKEVFTLTLQNGKTVTGTANHKILTKNGWIKLKDCKGEEVMCDTHLPVKCSKKEKRRGDKRIGGLRFHPYAREQSVGTSRYTKLIEYHRAVYEANWNCVSLDEYINILMHDHEKSEKMLYVDPSKYHIHHIDGDHYNNNIKNLQLLSVEEHLKLHSVNSICNFGQGVPYFSKCVSVTHSGKEDVYDIICKDPHRNFVANGIVVHNCGAGKSIIGLAFIALKKKPTLIIVHTLELFRQWEDEIKKHLYHDGTLGRIGGGHKTLGNITIAMIQTLVKMSEKEWNTINNTFEIMLGDECFPERTKVTLDNGEQVDINKIVNQKLSVNVLSFNLKTKTFESKPVVRWIKKKRELDLVRVFLNPNTKRDSFTCTTNHKIITTKGEVEAGKLTVDDIVYITPQERLKNSFSPDYGEAQMQVICGSVLGDGSLSVTENRLARLKLTHGKKQKAYLEYKVSIIGDMEISGPYISGYTNEYTIFQATTKCHRQLYELTNKAPHEIFEKLDERGLAIMFGDNGSCSGNEYLTLHTERYSETENLQFIKILKTKWNIQATLKQYRGYYCLNFSKSNSEKLASLIGKYVFLDVKYKLGKHGTNCEIRLSKDQLPYCTRYVHHIEKHLNQSNRRYDYVYNLEVKDNHNYLANNVLVSNCHHFGADSYMKVMKRNSAKYSLGLTATPKRKDGKNFIVSNYLGKVIYEITDQDLSAMGRSLECRVKIVNTNCVYNYTKMNENISVLNSVIAKDEKRNDIILECIRQDVEDDRTILVLTDRVIQGRILNAKLRSEGYRTDIIVGAINSQVRSNVKSKMLENKLQILVANKQIAAEGLNIPNIDSVHICFWTSNTQMLKQMIGRGRRATDDKDHCRVWLYKDKIMTVQVNDMSLREVLAEAIGFKYSNSKVKAWLHSQNFEVKECNSHGEELF